MNKDLFSAQSDLYVKYRPGYPIELVEYILQFVNERTAAWDCATGNGQAALLLASYFKMVEATDISTKQLSNAVQHPSIHYTQSKAEETVFNDHSFDLITVAQAYHWFDFNAFESEVRRVLKPDGILAIWGYSTLSSTYPAINEAINVFYNQTVGPYWDPERKYLDDHYRTIPFPYKELPGKDFHTEKQWNLNELLGYFNTWSSVQHFLKAKGFSPVDELNTKLTEVWPVEQSVCFRFPVFLRLGRI